MKFILKTTEKGTNGKKMISATENTMVSLLDTLED